MFLFFPGSRHRHPIFQETQIGILYNTGDLAHRDGNNTLEEDIRSQAIVFHMGKYQACQAFVAHTDQQAKLLQYSGVLKESCER